MAENLDFPTLCNSTQIRQATRHTSRFYDVCVAQADVHVTHYAMLGCLKHRGPQTMARPAQLIAMDRTTIGHNIRPLERDNVVSAAVNETDRHSRILSVTTVGLKCFEAGRPGDFGLNLTQPDSL